MRQHEDDRRVCFRRAGVPHSEWLFAMKETAKERMERCRLEWHRNKDAYKALNDQYQELCGRMFNAQRATNAAHQEYKDAKAIWRTGREFDVQDADNAAMLHKLQRQ